MTRPDAPNPGSPASGREARIAAPPWTGRRSAPLHEWSVTPAEALAIQRELARRVVVRASRRRFETVAGLDVSVRRGDAVCRAAAVLIRVHRGRGSAPANLETIAERRVAVPVPFPYVPGLLSFREALPLLEALRGLPEMPECLVVDGHGLAHPRRFGIACHIGVWCDLPSIGVAKSILVGEHGPIGRDRGARAALVHRGEIVGAALRTRTGVRPVYVSIGHRMDLDGACALALALAPRYRIVEPVRRAHMLAGA